LFTPQLNLFRDRRPTPRLSIGPSPALLTDARFIGNPIDFVVFDGYTQMKDEKGDTINVVLVEEKKGKGRLTLEVVLINRAVEEGRAS
jgi:predicted Holliday junction resolvase-like endonuclease